MNRMNRFLLLVAAALMAAMDVNAQTNEFASADEGLIRRRSCRVGTPNPHFDARRSPMLQHGENPYIGDRHQLVALASFQDRPFAEAPDSALTTWDRVFNAENFTEDQYVGSVRDYFSAQSYGQFNLKFDLVFVELPDNAQKYRSTSYDDENSQYMVDDIVDALMQEEVDWSLYDWDGDQFVNQLLIIYAGLGMNSGGGSNSIWPHQWWLSQHLNLETEDEEDFRSYRTVTCGDKEYHIDSYCCVQEVVNQTSLKTSFGTICHEYSHCFGFPDFYYGEGTRVVGDWDLMDDGNYANSGFRPCSYSAHERMLMGWLTPQELTTPQSIADIPALEDAPQAYLIRNDGAENEYYIVENRQRKGWDRSLPASGIVIFHVDYDKAIWESSTLFANSSSKKRYSIIPANNNSRVSAKSGWAYPYVNTSNPDNTLVNDSLTNTSQPAATLNNENADGTKLMSKPITRMYVNDNGLASFLFMCEEEATGISQPSSESLPSSPNAFYTLDGRRINEQWIMDNGQLPQGIYISKGRKVLVR